ncbi:MAG: hypothetical protein Q7U34_00405 [Anaerolineales bacterium]|nr:hypothetical protein [Anaerolineales bacterium]
MNIPYGPLLIVEDVPNVLELLEITLRFKGYPVVTARNGQEPLGEREFYQGYRERLENKLRQKNMQITRTERLLTTLPPDQRLAFEALLQQAKDERDEIQGELDHIYQILDEFKRSQN